jgi:hypothetical protein
VGLGTKVYDSRPSKTLRPLRMRAFDGVFTSGHFGLHHRPATEMDRSKKSDFAAFPPPVEKEGLNYASWCLGLRGFGVFVGTFPVIQYSNLRVYSYEKQKLKVFLRNDYFRKIRLRGAGLRWPR